MRTRNMYWSDPAKFDLAKMRADAYKTSRGDQFNEPQDVIIHHHHLEVPCKYPEIKDELKHEYFAAVIGEEK
jgi:hypothetical protein